jgi:hypothetical protein
MDDAMPRNAFTERLDAAAAAKYKLYTHVLLTLL